MNPVRKGLYQKLSGTAAVTNLVGTRIYHRQAPPDATYPLVIFSKTSGTKIRAFGDPNAFNREVWLVKAIDRGSSATVAEDVAAAIDTALDGGDITVAGKKLADLTHVADVSYPEHSGDQLFHHDGANYAVVLTAT